MAHVYIKRTLNISVKSSSLLNKGNHQQRITKKEKRNSPHVPKSSLLSLTQWRADGHCNDDIVGILMQKRIEIGGHDHLETMD
jgi:hypothetical protein